MLMTLAVSLMMSASATAAGTVNFEDRRDCGYYYSCAANPAPGGDEEDDDVDVWGRVPVPGDDGDGGDGGGGGDGTNPPQAWVPPCEGLDNLSPTFGCDPPRTPADEEIPISYPTVYASDLISFTPDAPSFFSEPSNAGLIGKATNFVADAAEHYQSGSLLGFEVAVAFVPVGYTFDYGDGSKTSTGWGGTGWADSGSAQFTATDTSHAYADRGWYSASVTTHYDAYVNFGTGIWNPVIGQVHASSNDLRIRVYQPTTGLVGNTCDEKPDGPGC